MQMKKVVATMVMGALAVVSLGSCVKEPNPSPKVSLNKEQTVNVSAVTAAAVAPLKSNVSVKGLRRAAMEMDNEKLFQAALRTVDKLRGNVTPEVKEAKVIDDYTKNILVGDCEIHSKVVKDGEEEKETGIVILSNITYNFDSVEKLESDKDEKEFSRTFVLKDKESDEKLVKVIYETEEETKENDKVEKEVELKYEFDGFEYSVELDDVQEKNKSVYEFEVESEVNGKEAETVYLITNNGNLFHIADKDNKPVAHYNKKEDGTFEKVVK